ncbi:MAG: hypothetical protein IPP48_08595 [Chitinophagaceae bacterium]|nr:hypothetical protein [Chitinophagaceae bacterium]
MLKLFTTLLFIIFSFSVFAQTDSSKTASADTIRIGGLIIIKKNKSDDVNITMGRNKKERKRNTNISTNWWIMDAGFSNYTDNTNYSTANSYIVNRPGYPALDKNDFKVNAGKSLNVNIWFFMQRYNLVKHHVNLKYGLGLELNNYHFKSPISYKENGTIPYTAGTQTNASFIFRDSVSFSKNKLAADYLTVPFMLNFTTHPYSRRKGLSASVGVSAGYLYSQRNKQKSAERGKDTNKGDYDLERFKFSYIAELGLGPVRLYGSYSPKSMYTRGLEQKPYTVGIRFSNW